MRAAIVIVTFENNEKLYRHLDALDGQSEKPDHIIIVNTGAANIMPGNYTVLKTADIGPAGGFREGAKFALENGFDYVVFADDDAIPCKDAVRYLRENMESGVCAVSGSFDSGHRIEYGNHYFMVRRDVLERQGLHHAPFFIYGEDSEFFRRISSACEVVHDPRIVIHHPFYHSYFTPFGLYITARNLLAYYAMGHEPVHFIKYFLLKSYSSICMQLYLGVPALSYFLQAVRDYSWNRLGKPKLPKNSLFRAGGPSPDPDALLFTRPSNNIRNGYEEMPISEIVPGNFMAFREMTRGRDLILLSEDTFWFLPFQPKRVFVMAKDGMHYLYQPTIWKLLLSSAIALALILSIPIAALLYLIKLNKKLDDWL